MDQSADTGTDVYGWTLAVRDAETVEVAKAGRATITIVHEPGMAFAVVVEYAGTRVLEAETEDAARMLAPEAPVRDVLTALWEPPPADPLAESFGVRELRSRFARDEVVDALRRRRNQHVAISQANQQLRAATRTLDGIGGQ